MDTPIIKVKSLKKNYKSKRVLDTLNWQIEPGEVIGLLGANGAGKTTLLECIMNLRDWEDGEITLWDKSFDNLKESERQQIAYVAQKNAGFEWMKVADYLNYIKHFYTNWQDDYCHQLVEKWRIDVKAYVGDLSGGQRQMLDVIQALSSKPKLLILDEPVAHMDPKMRRAFLSEVIELCCEQQTSVIFSTHIVSDLERIASKVAVLQYGKIRHFHDIDELKHSIAKVTLQQHSDKGLLKQLGFSNIKLLDHGISACLLTPQRKHVSELLQQHQLVGQVLPLTLEDWYLEVANEFA